MAYFCFFFITNENAMLIDIFFYLTELLSIFMKVKHNVTIDFLVFNIVCLHD
jgi:hypothetical protein